MVFMKKRFLSVFTMILTSMSILTACGGNTQGLAGNANENKINIVCTAFPQYDWVKNIIAGNEDKISLTLLNDNGGDLHNYQPSAIDMAIISDCDLFIYVGGESDGWVKDALKESVNENMQVINMMDTLGEKLIEGHSHEEHEGHVHDENEEVYDEHVWLSLHNAEVIVESICENIKKTDAENADTYDNNCKSYLTALNELDTKFESAVEASQTKTLMFADRFPFKYMTEDYGINYFAAFEGCSAETEASFETVAFLSEKTDELGLDTVLVIDGSDKKLAEVIIQNTEDKNQEILILDSLQTVSKEDMESGYTYLKAMESNLLVMEQALGVEK